MPSDKFYLRADIPSTTPQPDDAQGYLDAVAYPIFPIPSSSRLFPQSGHHRHPDPFQVSNNMNETGQYGYPVASSWAGDYSDWHPDYVSFDGSLPNHHEPTLSYYGNITYDNHTARRHDLLHTNNSATLDGCGSVASSSGMSDSDYRMSIPAPSFTAPAHFANDALISGTLHQYACAKQRRSRHDPGGGLSPYGLPETPQIGAYHDFEPPLHHHSEPLPIASPHSSALFGAVHDVTSPHPQRAPARPQARRSAETRRATTYRPPSPTELPYYGDRDASNRQDASSSSSSASISPMPSPFTVTPLDKAREAPKCNGPGPHAHSEKPKFKRGTPTKVACFFCRKRKIACGGPPDGSKDGPCKQCIRRSLECYYPEATQRGRRSPFPSGIPSDNFSMGLLFAD